MALKLRSYTREVKLKALLRWDVGESVEAVARDVRVRAESVAVKTSIERRGST